MASELVTNPKTMEEYEYSHTLPDLVHFVKMIYRVIAFETIEFLIIIDHLNNLLLPLI